MVTQSASNRSKATALADFRLIPRIDTFPALISFAQTTPGRILVLASFCLGMLFFVADLRSVLASTFLLALMTFMPELRHFILALTPIIYVVKQNLQNPGLLVLNLAVVILGIFLYWCAMRWPRSRFGQRPIAFLLGGFVILVLLACASTPSSWQYTVLWDLVSILAVNIWFIGYALLDRTSNFARDLTLELGTFRPLWGSTVTPFPKGAAYLRRIEARNSEQLAIVQLKGLKLLAWAILLSLFSSFWNRFFHGYLCIPTSADALAMSVNGTPLSWHVRWESQILYFFEVTLSFAIIGHRIISFCRLAGFDALRNSYRPLSSTTIAEFFNRFYYYFKELLVDFFFYPTFLRYWKGYRRIRMMFATFVSIAFGNSFFHLTRDWKFIQEAGPWKALVDYQVLFFYNVVLATAVSISQLRKRHPKDNSYHARILPALGVMFFYCVLSVFGDEARRYPLAVHFKYLASLFFIHY